MLTCVLFQLTLVNAVSKNRVNTQNPAYNIKNNTNRNLTTA